MSQRIDFPHRVRDYVPVQIGNADEWDAKETPAGALAKANDALNSANSYTDAEVQAAVKAGAVNPRGAWAAGTAYAKHDMVSHSGNSWYADEATVVGEEPGVSPKWVNYAGGIDKATADADYSRVVKANLTVTVGTGGDYATINAALDALSRRAPAYVNAGLTVEVRLLSGFTMAEQVFVKGLDLGWVTITSVDATVPIAGAGLTTGDPIATTLKPVWLGYDGATLPVVNTKFAISNPVALARVFRVRDQARLIIRPGAGCSGPAERLVEATSAFLHGFGMVVSGAGGIGLRLSNGTVAQIGEASVTGSQSNNVAIAEAMVNALDADFSGSVAGSGVLVSGPAKVALNRTNLSNCAQRGLIMLAGEADFTDGVATGCGISGVETRGNARADVTGATLTGAASYGVDAQGGSQVNATNAACTTAAGGIFGIRIHGGSQVNATGATGTLSQTPNIPTSAGTITVAGHQRLGASMSLGAVQSIATTTQTKVLLSGVRWDLGAASGATFADTVNNQLVIPAGYGGFYDISAKLNWSTAAAASGHREINIRRNGVSISVAFAPGSTAFMSVTAETSIELAAGDVIELYAFQASGGAVDLRAGSSETLLSLHQIGARGLV